jgi:hypothetical protein
LQTTGWVIALDDGSVAAIEARWQQGARWYIEPLEARASEEQLAWLRQHGEQVLDGANARAWRLLDLTDPG